MFLTLLTRPAVLVTLVVLVVLLAPSEAPTLRLVQLLEAAPAFALPR